MCCTSVGLAENCCCCLSAAKLSALYAFDEDEVTTASKVKLKVRNNTVMIHSKCYSNFEIVYCAELLKSYDRAEMEL